MIALENPQNVYVCTFSYSPGEYLPLFIFSLHTIYNGETHDPQLMNDAVMANKSWPKARAQFQLKLKRA